MKSIVDRNNKLSGLLFLLLGGVLIGCLDVHAQDSGGPDGKVAPPRNEKFQPAFDLVSPWRTSFCEGFVACTPPDDKVVTVWEYAAAHRLSIYNKDGSIWYIFSLDSEEGDYFARRRNRDFRPFATYPGLEDEWPDAVILRMTAESPNWYEVEVNESSRETKYVLKSGQMWARTTWDYWLLRPGYVQFDGSKVKLLEKPNGKIIDASSDIEFSRGRFIKRDGDWAFVEGMHEGKYYKGWIRWRDGRTILVGSAFNDHKIP